VGSRVEVAGSGSVLCWITWTIVPAEGWKGGKSWEWENCYFFRRKVDGTEGWEAVISDGEIEGLVRHVPGFFGRAFSWAADGIQGMERFGGLRYESA
jgi:hypothetical protein